MMPGNCAVQEYLGSILVAIRLGTTYGNGSVANAVALTVHRRSLMCVVVNRVEFDAATPQLMADFARQ